MPEAPDNRKGPTASSGYADIEVDLSLLAFHGLIPTIAASILGAGGTAGLLAIEYRDPWLTVLAVTAIALCAVRLRQVLTFPANEPARLTPRKARQLQNDYGVFTFLYCCTISLVVLYLTRIHSVQGLCLSLIGVFCICIGLASRSGLRPWIPQASGGVLLVSTAIAVFRSGFHLRWIGVGAIGFFAYQFFHALHNQFHILVEQLRVRRQLRILSEQDTLTGLANRRHFENSLAELCASADRFAILFIDLDRFKFVNDAYGHAAGDALLIQVGERLTRTIRASDLLARLGGDEFAILQTPLLSADSAKALAARINADIGEPFQIAGFSIQIGASIGIRLSETGRANADSLLSNADQALYQVKQAGGGGFSLANA